MEVTNMRRLAVNLPLLLAPIPGRLGSDVMVQLFLVMMAVASAKEPLIAGRAAIRVLKHHKVAEPIFDAASFRTKELFATAIRATAGLSVRSGFVHGKILCWGRLSYNAWRSHGQRLPCRPSPEIAATSRSHPQVEAGCPLLSSEQIQRQ